MYEQFEKQYSANQNDQNNNIFEIKKEQQDEVNEPSQNNPDDNEIVVDNDDYIDKTKARRMSTENPDKMFNNPFENSDEEDKFDAHFPDKNPSFDENFINDPAFKSFDKFVKFVKVEEEMFEEHNNQESSGLISDLRSENESVRSAIYSHEYGQKVKQRKKLIFGKEQLKHTKRRNRSLEDRVYIGKNFNTPRNIHKVKNEVRQTEADEVLKKRESDIIEESKLERRKSSLAEEFNHKEIQKPIPRRESILSEGKYEPTEQELEDMLEGMKDPFGKDWVLLEKEMKQKSVYNDFKTYKLRSLIFKSNDDLRQELLAIQLIKRVKKIFDEANLSLYLRPYEIIITSHSSGFIETIPNSSSIDSIKKGFPKNKNWTLADFFEKRFEYTFEE